MAYQLPELEYAYKALEPHIDERTMEIHHTKHHQAYIDKVNKALEGKNDLQEMSIEALMRNITQVPEEIRTTVRNNGGGHANHSLFWTVMSPDGGGAPTGGLLEEIDNDFGGFEAFKEVFSNAAKDRFGSGWAWLVVNDDSLEVLSTPNQDSPLMEGKTPILGLDVWEHAYYLHYQNKRPDYIEAWWNVVNWEQVQQNYEQATR